MAFLPSLPLFTTLRERDRGAYKSILVYPRPQPFSCYKQSKGKVCLCFEKRALLALPQRPALDTTALPLGSVEGRPTSSAAVIRRTFGFLTISTQMLKPSPPEGEPPAQTAGLTPTTQGRAGFTGSLVCFCANTEEKHNGHEGLPFVARFLL